MTDSYMKFKEWEDQYIDLEQLEKDVALIRARAKADEYEKAKYDVEL